MESQGLPNTASMPPTGRKHAGVRSSLMILAEVAVVASQESADIRFTYVPMIVRRDFIFEVLRHR